MTSPLQAHATGAGTGNTPLPGDFYVFVDNVCQGCPGGIAYCFDYNSIAWVNPT